MNNYNFNPCIYNNDNTSTGSILYINEVCLCLSSVKYYCQLSFQIYLNEALHYPNGYTVSTIPLVAWRSQRANSIIFNHNSTLPELSIVSIEIRPK